MSLEAKLLENSAANNSAQPRPFIKWAGGKSRLLSELVARVPFRFARYHEPFAGGAALFFRLGIFGAVLSDTNPELINALLVVRDRVDELIQDLSRHVYSSDYFYSIRDIDRKPEFTSWSEVQRASRFIYLNKTCFNGLYRVNSQGNFNVPFGDYSNPKLVDEENLRACSVALASTSIIEESFAAVVDRARSDDLVYFDPPYVPLSETANFTAYSKEGFGSELQESLRNVCRELDGKGVKFMLSNSYTDAVIGLYREFRIETVTAPRAINSKAEKRGRVKEVIVRNY